MSRSPCCGKVPRPNGCQAPVNSCFFRGLREPQARLLSAPVRVPGKCPVTRAWCQVVVKSLFHNGLSGANAEEVGRAGVPPRSSLWALGGPHPLSPRWGSGEGGGAVTQGWRPGLWPAAPSGAGGRTPTGGATSGRQCGCQARVQLGALGYGPPRLAALGVGLRRVAPPAGSETGAASPKCMPRAVPLVAATIAATSPLLAPRTESPRAPVAPRCLSFPLGDRCPAGLSHAPGTGGERGRGRHSSRHWPPRHATGAGGGGRAPHSPPSSTACEGVVHRKRRDRRKQRQVTRRLPSSQGYGRGGPGHSARTRSGVRCPAPLGALAPSPGRQPWVPRPPPTSP